jgi:hypothetical protein
MRSELYRAEILRLLHEIPFKGFAISLENGQILIIEHPENVAFDPTPGGRNDLYVLSSKLRSFTTFDAISMVATLDSLMSMPGTQGV